MRTSIFLKIGEVHLVVDCGPDFRQQMIREKINRVDAILMTHEHNDHVVGLDDVRPFNFKYWKDMPIYATPRVQADIKKRFGYIFAKDPYPGTPKLDLITIGKESAFTVDGVLIQPIEVMHGQLPVLGFRLNDFTYITDIKTISTEELEKVKGTKVLVISALHHKAHHSHLNLEEAITLINEIQPQEAYLTHMSHRMGKYEDMQKQLPDGIFLAYDGLRLTVG